MHYTVFWNCARKFLNSNFEGFNPLNLTHSNLDNINNVYSFDRLRLLLLEGTFSFLERF